MIWNIKKFPGTTEQVLRIKVGQSAFTEIVTMYVAVRDLLTSGMHVPSRCCLLQITLATGGPATGGNPRKEVGPVSMSFEIPMYNVSNLQVRYLRISEQHKSYNPYR